MEVQPASMEACVAVEKELEKVLTKFGAIKSHSSRAIGDLIDYVSSLQNELAEGFSSGNSELTAAKSLILAQCMKKVNTTVSRIATDHRDLHSTVSKVGKAIDRNYTADFGMTANAGLFECPDKQKYLNQVICQHFYRQGMLDIGEELTNEANLELEESQYSPFIELNRILECLKQGDLSLALEWAEANRDALRANNSSLEFKLHRLHFIDLLTSGPVNQSEAVAYARKYFSPFATQHEQEIQVLMGCLLYIREGLQKSPARYSTLLDPVYWAEICEVFTRDSCALLGLSVDSPLVVCLNAGCTALPALLNIKQVMLQRQVPGVWNVRDELPIEVDLGCEFRYHSIFACPILRQQSSDSNPPMKLVCGHMISRDALNKLTNGNKLKCPYCPMEQNPSDARLVTF